MRTISSIVADFFIIYTTVKSMSSYFFCSRLMTTITSILVKYYSAELPRLLTQLVCNS